MHGVQHIWLRVSGSGPHSLHALLWLWPMFPCFIHSTIHSFVLFVLLNINFLLRGGELFHDFTAVIYSMTFIWWLLVLFLALPLPRPSVWFSAVLFPSYNISFLILTIFFSFGVRFAFASQLYSPSDTVNPSGNFSHLIKRTEVAVE